MTHLHYMQFLRCASLQLKKILRYAQNDSSAAGRDSSEAGRDSSAAGPDRSEAGPDRSEAG